MRNPIFEVVNLVFDNVVNMAIKGGDKFEIVFCKDLQFSDDLKKQFPVDSIVRGR